MLQFCLFQLLVQSTQLIYLTPDSKSLTVKPATIVCTSLSSCLESIKPRTLKTKVQNPDATQASENAEINQLELVINKVGDAITKEIKTPDQ